MKLNEKTIRNVVRRVINEVIQNDGTDIIASYNDYLSTQASGWSYDGENLTFNENGFTFSIPLSVEDLMNGNNEPINNFDESTLTAQFWLEGKIPQSLNNSDVTIGKLYDYITDSLSDLWTYGMPTNFVNSFDDDEYE